MRVRVIIENVDECEPVAAWDLDLGELSRQCATYGREVSPTRGAMAFVHAINDLESEIGQRLTELAREEEE